MTYIKSDPLFTNEGSLFSIQLKKVILQLIIHFQLPIYDL